MSFHNPDCNSPTTHEASSTKAEYTAEVSSRNTRIKTSRDAIQSLEWITNQQLPEMRQSGSTRN
jgi:hypothetical protein